MTQQDRPWTTNELAKAAGMDDSSIRKMCVSGSIPGAYKVAKTWLIPRDVGDQWLAERKAKWSKF